MSFDKVNLSEVIDLALGSQNFGVVDFKLLHSLLHIIVEKLSNIFVHLKNKEIESEIANSINNKSIMNDIKNFKTFDDKVKPQNAINIAHAQMNNEATVKHIESLHDSLSTIMSNKNCTIEAMSNENSNLKIITNRVEDIEKSIKHLTLLSNDLTREFHKIQQNITSCTESKEIENLKDRLDVLLYKQYSNDIESLPSVIPKNELEYHHNHSRESNKTFEGNIKNTLLNFSCLI